jgi:hypothetical protein
MSRFEEVALGSASYVPGVGASELGFDTQAQPSGGLDPLAAVRQTTAFSNSPVLTHRSVAATTAMAAVDMQGWTESVAFVSMAVASTTYETSDFVRIYVTNGQESVDLYNARGGGPEAGLNEIAGAGFRTFSAEVPPTWSQAALVIESFSDSSQAAEFYDFDDMRIVAVAVPEPPTATLAMVAVILLCASHPSTRRHLRAEGAFGHRRRVGLDRRMDFPILRTSGGQATK